MKKDFDVIYDELKKDSSNMKMNPIKSMIISIGLILVTTVLFFVFLDRVEHIDYLCLISLIIYIISFVYLILSKEKYIKKYKNNIIKKIIEEYNGNLNYDIKYNIGVNTYKESMLSVNFDTFSSRDGIVGKIGNEIEFRMSHVATSKKIQELVDGKIKTTTVQLFSGLFGVASIKGWVKKPITIKLNDITKNYNKKRIELESKEFEKKFDCFSEDKIVALQVVTSETIEKINKLFSKYKVPMEFNVIGNMMFFRILIKDIFMPPRFKSAMNKDNLENIYNILSCLEDVITIINRNSTDI